VLNAGDAHLYVNHLEQVDTQIARDPLGDPRLSISADVREIDDFRYHHAVLHGYAPQAEIKGEVAI
jgi:thymidylate synthase